MSQSGTQRRSLRQRLESERGRALVVGHRGAMGYRPENTLPSFEHALELGAECVEFDVHLSRDGVPVVIHDESVDRTTNGHGQVRDLTVAELQQLDAGAWFDPRYAGARIPTLDEVLDWARRSQMAVDIEIKNGPFFYPDIEARVVEAVDRAGLADQTLVSSFDHHAVKRVGELDARLVLGVLYSARPFDAPAVAAQVGAAVLLPHVAYAREDDVRAAHACGLAYVPWTTSDVDIIRALIAAGVDGICSNHPDTPRRLLDERANGVAAAGAAQ